MGCGPSKETAAKYESSQQSNTHGHGKQGAHAAGQQKDSRKDFGLSPDFEVLKLLGTGGEGETWLCIDKRNQQEVAIKLVHRPIPKSITQIIQREIKILADLGDGCLNIVHADEVVLTKSHLGLVMEYVKGGNMVGYVTALRETRDQRGGLVMDEDTANYYFRQLIWAVAFCHRHQVAHRDLKLDNALITGDDPPRMKLCDFGFAKSWMGANPNMDTMRIGTPEYMGPELISGRSGYDGKKVDVWAAGVLLYVMLMGSFPFEMEDDNYVNTAGLYSIWIQQIRTSWQANTANNSAVARLSPEVRDLLDRMFDVNQDTRVSVEDILVHPWFTRPLPPKYEAALARMKQEQAAIDATEERRHHRDKERDAALQMLLEKAALAPTPGEGLVRVPLTRSAMGESGALTAAVGMPPISEGPALAAPQATMAS